MSLKDKLEANAVKEKAGSASGKTTQSRQTVVAKNKAQASSKGSTNSAKSRMKTANSKKEPKEHFERLRMWISVLTSMTMKDRGKIPEDIGDNILISNNMFTTKLFMCSLIHIVELGVDTPITTLGCIREALCRKKIPCLIDFVMKNEYFEVKLKDAGLRSRIEGWENSLVSDMATPRMKERAARCLYTVQVATKGDVLYRTRVFLKVLAKTGHDLEEGEKCIYTYLNSIGCTYEPVYSDVQSKLEYTAMISDYHSTDLKDIASVVMSPRTLAEMLPNCGSINDKQGVLVAMDIVRGLPYRIDFSSITMARNIYIVAPSGVGKTVVAVNIAQSALENGSAACFMDIKGNEYNNLVNSVGGYVVSLRESASEYINTWVMYKDDVDDDGADAYFKQRYNFSKKQMIVLSGITDKDDLGELEELLDNFHNALYVSLGVIPDNRNTWMYSEGITPYDVYERFDTYMTPELRKEYKTFSKKLMGNLRLYMSRNGSKSHVFRREFDYASILKCKAVSFDFGILATHAEEIDWNLFRLKFLYMQKLNAEFVTANYANGRRTLKILEESQVVSAEVMQMYVEEYTLRRSQMQDTLLLGNSVSALMNKEAARPIVENTNCLMVGQLGQEAREKVIEEFGIKHLSGLLQLPGSEPDLMNSFVVWNRMQKKVLYPIVKVIMDPTPNKYKVLTPVRETNSATGV